MTKRPIFINVPLLCTLDWRKYSINIYSFTHRNKIICNYFVADSDYSKYRLIQEKTTWLFMQIYQCWESSMVSFITHYGYTIPAFFIGLCFIVGIHVLIPLPCDTFWGQINPSECPVLSLIYYFWKKCVFSGRSGLEF